MQKILVLFIFGVFLLNGIGAATIYDVNTTDQSIKTINTIVKRSSFSVQQTAQQDFMSIRLDDTNTYLSKPGKPLIPKIVKTFELPFNAKDISIEITPQKQSTQYIEGYIEPASTMLPLSTKLNSANTFKKMDMQTYNQNSLYPETFYKTKIGVGLNQDNQHVTFVKVEWYPIQYNPTTGKIITHENVEIDVSYQPMGNQLFTQETTYDLLIIAPDEFTTALQPLVEHKKEMGFKTTLNTTEEIYNNQKYADKIDQAEQIKHFIKDAMEKWNVTYVLLVGGLKNVFYAKPRDNCNLGSSGWHVPVRYTNMYDDPAFPLSAGSIHDPGVISDLYYADIYKKVNDENVFASWNPNNDDSFAALGKPDVEDDVLDFYPDIILSRLACRNVEEVNTVVNKIINYESTPIDPSWFEKMIVVSGDGFLDQTDLNIKWDTSEIADGKYTIHAKSYNPLGEHGPTTSIEVIKNSSSESSITYSHDDHLNPAIQDAFENGFPTVPIAEIVSISDGDILGKTNISFDPPSNDYCNEFYYWANVSYIEEVLTIRGKSYDPKPYGNLSSIHVWITDNQGERVFSKWRNDTEMYYEGEWTTGEKELLGRGGALYYMPEEFEKEILWTSNGRLTGINDVLSAVNKGSGFLFFSGHGSPNVWADQYPGIPGDRAHSSVTGMKVTSLKPWPPFFSKPLFPMDTLSNGEKLPIAVVGGCHNSQFNVSMVLGLYDILPYLFPSLPSKSMWCHGVPVPETFSWRLISNPTGGAIASMGNTGLGYGMPGKELTTGGGDSWITIEFFRQYGEEGEQILGNAYTETLKSYINTFDMTDLSAGHPKTITQWVLLGDPTLKIGGYE